MDEGESTMMPRRLIEVILVARVRALFFCSDAADSSSTEPMAVMEYPCCIPVTQPFKGAGNLIAKLKSR